MTGKGSKRRPLKIDKERFDTNWDSIFSKDPKEKNVNFRHIQQDVTELNGDGNRERGRYGEDLSQNDLNNNLL